MPRERATDALLVAAASRAAGGLQTLDLEGRPWLLRSLFAERSLVTFAATHGGAALRELRAPRSLNDKEVAKLLRAAPRLRTLRTDVTCTSADAVRGMLRREPPYAPALQLGTLELHGRLDATALLADVAACPSPPTGLSLVHAPLRAPGALDALVSTTAAVGLRALSLMDTKLPPAHDAVPALSRLLSAHECALTHLALQHLHLVRTPDDAELLSDALRGAGTLRTLELMHMRLWRFPDMGAALLGDLAAHPALRTLRILDDKPAREACADAGAALGALLSADTSTLLSLDVTGCKLREAGLAPLLAALPRATRLRALVLNDGVRHMSSEFEARTLLPAVSANASLWRLRVRNRVYGAAREAVLLARARRVAAGVSNLANAGVDVDHFSTDDEDSEADSEEDDSDDDCSDIDACEDEEAAPVVVIKRLGDSPTAFEIVAFDFPPQQ